MRASLDAYSEGRITPDAFFRAAMEHDGWHVPLVGDGLAVLTLAANVRAVFVFTDAEAVGKFAGAKPDLAELVAECEPQVLGDYLFGFIEQSPARSVWINPGSPAEMKFENADLAAAFAWAHTVELERALLSEPEGPDLHGALAAYTGYRVITPLPRAPAVPKGELSYVPVFTAPDHLAAYAASHPPDEALDIEVHPARTLFELLRDSKLDGIVFNPSSPDARSFPMQICDAVLAIR